MNPYMLIGALEREYWSVNSRVRRRSKGGEEESTETRMLNKNNSILPKNHSKMDL